MQWFTDSNEMLDSLHTLLTQTVRARSYQIFVQDEKTGVFSLFRAFPPLSNGRVPKLHGGSAICRLFEVGKVPYLGFREGSAGVGDAELEQAAWEQVKPFGADYCFVLLTDENPFGLFLIGPKASAEPYTLHDLELLTELVTNLSLHLNQMRLKKQILLAQEMDLLGMMSRGMAHDLNNLITPVWTFLQLAREKARPEEGHNELLPTVSRNVETMMAYIRESLFFSDTQTPHLNIASLPGTVRQAVELARPRAAVKGIQLVCADMPEAEVEVDTVMIQRLVNNLLANAIDASPERAQITVQISRLETTDTSREWYRIEVVDQGEGISRENLKQVLMPYFTTKDRGDERRGFGLGLAICRKVVHLHGGNLNILSEEGRGTTVQVDLPSRQMPVNGEAARA
jgi:signal transduction histidine kinase